MTKTEFLEKLQAALENDLDGGIIREQISYYGSYIDGEVRKGRREQDVLDELGDPWVLAQTVIDAAEQQKRTTYTGADAYESRRIGREQSDIDAGGAAFFSSGGWKLVLVLVAVLVFLALLVTLVGGILSFFAPILVPVLLVVMFVRFFKRR